MKLAPAHSKTQTNYPQRTFTKQRFSLKKLGRGLAIATISTLFSVSCSPEVPSGLPPPSFFVCSGDSERTMDVGESYEGNLCSQGFARATLEVERETTVSFSFTEPNENVRADLIVISPDREVVGVLENPADPLVLTLTYGLWELAIEETGDNLSSNFEIGIEAVPDG